MSLGPDGDAAALWAEGSDLDALRGRRTDAGGASFPDERVEPGVRVQVSVQSVDGAVSSRTGIEDFAYAHPRLAVLPDGAIVVASARCSWQDASTLSNAALYSPDGLLLARGLLGDGVDSLTSTGRGDLWVGYFDEGIFGSWGWRHPGPGAKGAAGLLRCSRSFEVEWSYPVEDVEPIDDSPHLNLVGDVVWLTYDSAYPIARIADGQVSTWMNSTGPAFAVLVDGDAVALLSQEATIGRVEGRGFVPTAMAELGLARRPLHGVARGTEYHSFGADGSWTTVSLAELVEASVPV